MLAEKSAYSPFRHGAGARLTPELSRPVAGRRMRASVAQSTQPTTRHGVGLNELLDAAARWPNIF